MRVFTPTWLSHGQFNITSIDLQREGGLIISGGTDSIVRIWRTVRDVGEPGERVASIKLSAGVINCVRWAPEQSQFGVACEDGRASLWKFTPDPPSKKTWVVPDEPNELNYCMTLCSLPKQSSGRGAQAFSIDWSPSGDSMVIGGTGQFVIVDCTRSLEKKVISFATQRCRSVSWNPVKGVVAMLSEGAKTAIQFYDVDRLRWTDDSLEHIYDKCKYDKRRAVTWSPDGEYLAATGAYVTVSDSEPGEPRRKPAVALYRRHPSSKSAERTEDSVMGHDVPVTQAHVCVASFAPCMMCMTKQMQPRAKGKKGAPPTKTYFRLLASGCADGRVLVTPLGMDARALLCVGNDNKSPVVTLAWAADASLLYVCCEDGTNWAFELPTEWMRKKWHATSVEWLDKEEFLVFLKESGHNGSKGGRSGSMSRVAEPLEQIRVSASPPKRPRHHMRRSGSPPGPPAPKAVRLEAAGRPAAKEPQAAKDGGMPPTAKSKDKTGDEADAQTKGAAHPIARIIPVAVGASEPGAANEAPAPGVEDVVPAEEKTSEPKRRRIRNLLEWADSRNKADRAREGGLKCLSAKRFGSAGRPSVSVEATNENIDAGSVCGSVVEVFHDGAKILSVQLAAACQYVVAEEQFFAFVTDTNDLFVYTIDGGKVFPVERLGGPVLTVVTEPARLCLLTADHRIIVRDIAERRSVVNRDASSVMGQPGSVFGQIHMVPTIDDIVIELRRPQAFYAWSNGSACWQRVRCHPVLKGEAAAQALAADGGERTSREGARRDRSVARQAFLHADRLQDAIVDCFRFGMFESVAEFVRTAVIAAMHVAGLSGDKNSALLNWLVETLLRTTLAPRSGGFTLPAEPSKQRQGSLVARAVLLKDVVAILELEGPIFSALVAEIRGRLGEAVPEQGKVPGLLGL